MEIILFRHYDTAYSKEHRICGRIDCSIISNKEIDIPTRIISLVSNKKIIYYSSPLRRCGESVRLLNDQLKRFIIGSSIIVLPQLIEREWGPLSGLTKKEVLNKYKADIESLKNTISGIESDESVRKRLVEAFNLISIDKGCVPIVATHKGCIKQITRFLGINVNNIDAGSFLIVNIKNRI